MFSTATTPVIIKTDIDALMQKDKFGWASRLLSSFSLRSLTIHKNLNFHNLLCYGLHNTHIASQLSAFLIHLRETLQCLTPIAPTAVEQLLRGYGKTTWTNYKQSRFQTAVRGCL